MGFGLDDLGLHLRHAGDHFLLECDRGRTADFRLRLSHVLVGLGLRFLELRADVFADIDIGNVDRKNFKRRAHIESAVKYDLGN